jgi:hypothetical protein
MRLSAALCLALLSLAGCPTEDGPKARTPEDFGPATEGDTPVPIGEAANKPNDHANDAPEISRSRGPKGGVVVLWPRVFWPKGDEAVSRELATKVQRRLGELAKRAVGARSIDVRPEPEKVCPQEGCIATSLGAVIVVRDKACAVVATAAGPNASPWHLLPWAGKAQLAKDTVPFRDPPEDQVKIVDYVACDKLLEGTEDKDAELARYIAGLMPGG